MIQCKECGWSFRRTVRTYQNTYIRWVCSGHNGKGADSCPNAVTVDEGELIRALEGYFAEILKNSKMIGGQSRALKKCTAQFARIIVHHN